MKKMVTQIACFLLFSLLLLPAISYALDEGDMAPAFIAQSTQGEMSLADYAGKKHVILALYFAVFTSV